MKLQEIQNAIRELAVITETDAPFVTCYADLEGDPRAHRRVLGDRLFAIRPCLPPAQSADFEDAFKRIMAFLASRKARESSGVAVFSRGGKHPCFRAIPLRVPVPNHLSVDAIPNLFQLVALKDAYHRYVVLIVHRDHARILEVDVGEITRELWSARPELRDRVGRAWTHEHYQNHKRDRGDRFLDEKIGILDKLMVAGEQTHLVLAGSPEITARIRQRLPKRLQDRLVDVVTAATRDKSVDVVSATLARFIEHEQQESVQRAGHLVAELRRGGLAAADTFPTLLALQRGQVDVLVVADGYQPPGGWACRDCRSLGQAQYQPAACPDCGNRAIREADLKSEMVRLAELHNVEVEVLRESDALFGLGGVGCLLKYQTLEEYFGDGSSE